MQRIKHVEIGGRSITIRELRVRDVRDLWDSTMETNLPALKATIETLLPKLTDLAGLDDILDFYPSEIKELWTAIQVVNADFFEGATALGLGPSLEAIEKALVVDLTVLSAVSWPPDTAPEPGNTVGVSS